MLMDKAYEGNETRQLVLDLGVCLSKAEILLKLG